MSDKPWRWLPLLAAFMLLVLMITACGERPKPQVESRTRPLTEEAQTRIAQTNAPPTSGPSPTPSVTPSPYLTATPFPDADPNEAVAQVGDRVFSLAEFQARVRYERWLPLKGLERNIERFGTERILDLSRSENAQTLALFYTLGDYESMGLQSLDLMIIEEIVRQEARARDLELDTTFYYGRIAPRIGVELLANGERPDRWDEAYADFITEMELYTGMSEEDFLAIMRALTYYEQLRRIIGNEAPITEIDEEGITRVVVQDIWLNTQEQGVQAIELLGDGTPILSIAREFNIPTDQTDTRRTVRRGDEELPTNIVDALFEASEGDIVGPYPTTDGWYVAAILEQELDILQPGDIEQAREDYYRNWINERFEDPELVTVYDYWQDFIPTDPLPRDVSPYMEDEYFTLPPDPYAETGATVTPIPLSDIQSR